MPLTNAINKTSDTFFATSNITANFTSPVLTTVVSATTYTNRISGVLQSTNESILTSEYYSNTTTTATGSFLYFTRALGTKSAPVNLTSTQVPAMNMQFAGYISGAFADRGYIRAYVNSGSGSNIILNSTTIRLGISDVVMTNSAFFSNPDFTSDTIASSGPLSILNQVDGSASNSARGYFAQTGGVTGNRNVGAYTFTNTAAQAAALFIARARGTGVSGPNNVSANDGIGEILFAQYLNFSFRSTASIRVENDNSISGSPGRMIFYTVPVGTNTLTEAMRINSSQIVTLAQPLPVGSGGLGITTVPTNGQIPIGNGTTYTAATLTAGSGVTITNAAGSVTIAAAGGTSWKTISANQTLVVGEGYFCISPGGALSLALPAVSAVGATIEIVLAGATSWTVTQGAGQQVVNGNVSSTLGATGTTASTAQGDSVRLVCAVADTIWYIVNSFGNINSV